MSYQKNQRKRLFVDPRVQGALIGRVVLYWIVCLLGVTLMLLCWRMITARQQLLAAHFDGVWLDYRPALIASLLLMPLVIIDILRLSNRFVGPLLRLRRSMRALGRGERVDPIEFRSTDFWRELADEFNAVLARVRTLEASCRAQREVLDANYRDEATPADAVGGRSGVVGR